MIKSNFLNKFHTATTFLQNFKDFTVIHVTLLCFSCYRKLISCLRQVLNYTGENDKMENLKNTMMVILQPLFLLDNKLLEIL